MMTDEHCDSNVNVAMAIPTITLDLTNPQRNFEREQIDVLREACERVGFFYLRISRGKEDVGDDDDDDNDVNAIHTLLPRVFRQSRAFFSLPQNIKRRISNPVLNRGYTGMEEETLDPVRQKISGRGDTKEGYYIGEDIHESDVRYNPDKLSGPNMWPTKHDLMSANADRTRTSTKEEEFGLDSDFDFNCDEWKSCMMAYHAEMKKISFQVVQMLARALDLDKHHFDECFQEPMALIRLLHYSKEKSHVEKGIFACGAHSDYGMITLLATDDTPGLQIFYTGGNEGTSTCISDSKCGNDDVGTHDGDGMWIDIPPPPAGSTSFVVNLGDMMERWTNGKFRSTLHRVVSRGRSERYSIPFFYEPNFDTVVEPLENCIESEVGPKYPPTTSGQHLLDKYNETHADFEMSTGG